MYLPDFEIENRILDGQLGIEPFDPAAVQPASIDLRLDERFLGIQPGREYLDPARDSAPLFFDTAVYGPAYRGLLAPGECALGSTYEKVTIPRDLVGRVEGKSSLGRLFLLVHATAGFIDPGFSGHITLELVNLSPRPIWLYPGMKIAQLSLQTMVMPAINPYGRRSVTGNHYQNQPRGPVPSRSHERFTHGLPETTCR